MAKLICESNYNVTLNEDEKKNMYIEGIFASAERRNENKRVYPKHILQREYDKIMESVRNRTALGELGHPERSDVSLQHAAIIIEDMEWKDNDIHGKAKILNTPMGNIARSLIEDECRYGVSTRGLGSVNEDGRVNEDFTWLTVDIVSNPSNQVSWVNGILEGKDFPLPAEKRAEKEAIDEQERQKALDEHFKRVWQVLENLSKGE